MSEISEIMSEISEIDKKLNAILGVEYDEQESKNDLIEIPNNEIEIIKDTQNEIELVTTPTIDQSDIDFEFARQNIKELSNIGMENIKKLSTIAKDSQTPRMFEVLSGFIKNISDINSNLIDIHTKKLSSSSEETVSSNINVNQAIICTGSDMLKRIKERKNNK